MRELVRGALADPSTEFDFPISFIVFMLFYGISKCIIYKLIYELV